MNRQPIYEVVKELTCLLVNTLATKKTFTLKNNSTPARSLKNYFSLLLTLSFLILQNSLTAQCTMACNGTTPEGANQISMLANCEVIIVPDDILEGSDSCMSNKIIEIRATGVGLVVRGEDRVVFNGTDFIDKILTVKVMDADGTSCWGYLSVKDKLAPDLECFDAEILCNEDTSPDNTGYPIIIENCDSDVEITFVDSTVENDCNSPFARTITRTWHVVDTSGNAAICEQKIFLRRLDLTDIQFPENIELDCEYPLADTSITGEPMIGIMPVRAGTTCNIHIAFTDQLTSICGSTSYQIQRSWSITDNCTGHHREALQNIRIIDDTPPVLDCPRVLTFGTDNGNCSATIQLPQINATDNCSNNVTVSVRTSYGAEGFAAQSGVEQGWHTVTYTAIDDCGNRSTCEVAILVADDSPPQIACDDELIVSIVGSQRAMLEASTIDGNSFDNCDDYLLYSAARMDADSDGDGYPENTDFRERVEFNCADIATTVPVLIRVVQGNNPDLYSECIVQVSVEDKIPPIFDEIDNIYIDCTTDYSDLSVFPTPRVEDNCELELVTAIEQNINNCGVGEIKRIFTATDGVGNVTTRTQTIFVENQNPFVADSIDWPEDYIFTNNCHPETAPEMLPIEAREPRFRNGGCELLAKSYRDEVFEIAENACFKIRRIWQVIDWCNYTPEASESHGLFTYVQTIKIIDTTAPEITCPAQVRAGANNDCNTGTVNVPLPQVTDCSGNVEIINDSPYAFNNGADASGVYPVGATTVTFTAHDRCGNRTNCTMTIIVADDQAPTAVCRDGIIGNLVSMNGQGMVMIEAAMLNGSSSDNCTANSDLNYTIRRKRDTATDAPTATMLSFNCNELGSQTIELWVTDAAGNSAYCETIVQIQDNSLVCPSNTDRLPRIGGKIQTADGEDVESVMVKVNSNNQQLSTNPTDVTGHYQFDNVHREQAYQIVPERNADATNGVSTLDLIIITKHILGIQTLDSPYTMIAADANNSGTISTLDLIAIRKIILQLTDEFPNNTAWRFIPTDYQFANPNDPCAEAFPEWSNIDYLMNDELQTNFTAIKIGDVNNSAIPNALVTVDNRSDQKSMRLNTDNQQLTKDETYQIPIYIDNDLALTGLQFALKTANGFTIKDIQTTTLTNLNETHFRINKEENQLKLSWNGDVKVSTDEPLFHLEIAANKVGGLQDVLSIEAEQLNAELYTEELTTHPLVLVINDLNTIDNSLMVYQNTPNPFAENTAIGFDISHAERVTLRVFDIGGKLLYQAEKPFEKGYHEWSLQQANLQQSGMLYYQLSTTTQLVTKKMIVLK